MPLLRVEKFLVAIIQIGPLLAVPAATAHGAGATRDPPGARALTTAPLRFIGAPAESGMAAGASDPRGLAGAPAPPRPLQFATPPLRFIGAASGSDGAAATPAGPSSKTVETGTLNFVGSAPTARPRPR